ncbi:MAG: hypothetical protein JXA42_06350 [Anaerolineales bacterium]|nr:hypothetical protein [Anaerolineales bacterium]
MSDKGTEQVTRRQEVIKAIERRNPSYVPGWLKFFATETRDLYGQALEEITANYEDDVIVSVLSTFPPMSEMPNGWADEWGCQWAHSPDGVGAVSIGSPLYENYDRLNWYLDNGLPGLEGRTDILDRVTRARAENPDRYLMATTYLAVFERLRCLRGAENLLIDLHKNPGELSILRDAVAEEFAGQIRGIGARGGDAVLLADDVGAQNAMLINPKHWRKFLRPTYEWLVEEIHNQGMHAWYHSCGYIYSIIPDLIEIGFDLLHPLQPSSMDLRQIADSFSGQICFAGAIDVQALLPHKTSLQVEDEIRETIDILDSPQGGYLLAPTNSIMPDTPLENIEAMFRAAKKYGRLKRKAG